MSTVATAYKTPQETFWAGEFGDAYTGRDENQPEQQAGQLSFFARALEELHPAPASICEFGAGIGLNLRALKILFPHAHQSCVEINAQAVERLRRDGIGDEVIHDSILNFTPTHPSDLVLIKGMMMHLPPDVLPDVYRKLAAASSRHVLIAEHYNRRLDEIGGGFMTTCPEFQLVDYGFSYHGDLREQREDLTWFLFERRNPVSHTVTTTA